jgi:hypothetical protein
VIKSKYLLELTQHIPIRNINFYVDAFDAMCVANQYGTSIVEQREIEELEDIIREQSLERSPNETIGVLVTTHSAKLGIKTIGKLILSSLRLGRFHNGSETVSHLPFAFLTYVVVEDLKLHGQGPCYTLVEKFTGEITQQEATCSERPGSNVQAITAPYTHEDMAAIFLGYSFLSRGAQLPLVPFPSNKTGFVARLYYDVNKLFPRLFSPMI